MPLPTTTLLFELVPLSLQTLWWKIESLASSKLVAVGVAVDAPIEDDDNDLRT